MFKMQKKECKTTRLINTAFTLKALLEDNKDMILLPLSCLNSFLTSDKIDPVSLPLVNYQVRVSDLLNWLFDIILWYWSARFGLSYECCSGVTDRQCDAAVATKVTEDLHGWFFQLFQRLQLQDNQLAVCVSDSAWAGQIHAELLARERFVSGRLMVHTVV